MVYALASIAGGATSFGNALIAAPFLLLIGFPLQYVVTINLALNAATRSANALRFRAHRSNRRVALLLLGSLPGLFLGSTVLARVDESAIKLVTGLLVMLAAVLMLRAAAQTDPRPPVPGGALLAGFGSGLLGASTSLSGVAPVLLLARERTAKLAFLADLSIFFLFSSLLALGFLAVQGVLVREALLPGALLWLPGALLGNQLGVRLAERVSQKAFGRLVLGLMFVTGALTALSA